MRADQLRHRRAPTRRNNTVSSNYTNYSHEVELQSVGKRDIDWLVGAVLRGNEKNDIRFDIPVLNGTQQGTVAWQGSFIQPKETVASAPRSARPPGTSATACT